MRKVWLVLSLMLWAWPMAGGAATEAQQRAAMVREILAEVELTRDYLQRASLDPRLIAALGKVPRHEFIPLEDRDEAYANRPVPIGFGQTISQPYIVAIMTDLLNLKPGDRVLEVGTGSGYQAAILAELVDQVYTLEIVPALSERAAAVLARLAARKVTVRTGDGYYGWPEHAPFDAIVVTAAASHIPPPLIAQLKPGGRMVIPVGSRFFVQQLVLVEKGRDGRVTTRQILPVRFVPLTGGH